VLALTKGGFSMDFVEQPDGIDDWNPTTEEGQQPPVPPAVNASNIPTPVINLIQAKASNNSVYIRVVVIDPADDSFIPVVRYRVADIGAGTPGAWIEQPFPGADPSGGYINLNTNTVPVDQELQVQVAFKASNGKYSNWSVTEEVTSTADPTPPGVVTSPNATGGVGAATFNWNAPNSSNYAGAKIYWNTVNNFGTASYAGPPEYGASSSADSTSRSFAAGTYYGWIVSINHSGIEGASAATGTFTVT